MTRYFFVRKKLYILFVMLWGCVCISRAQYDPSFSHYFDMEASFNPAAIGKQSKVNVVAAYALDLAGFEHNPQTAYLSADMPFYALKTYHGVGVQFQNDKLGLFTHQKLGLQYALRTQLFGGQLGIGAQLSFLNESFDASKLDVEDANHATVFYFGS